MIAIDTNVVVRFLANDHPDQSSRARQFILANETWLSLTVCLETEWVLRSAYKASPKDIAQKLTDIAGLSGVIVEDPETLATAISWFREGMDFADALHLARSSHCTAMLSFDDKFVRAAQRLGTIPVHQP